MKRVKMLTCMAGSGFVRNVGDVVEVQDDEANRLIDAVFAELVSGSLVASEAGSAELSKPTTDKKEEQPKRRGRPPANRETPAAPPPVEPPASEPPAVTEPPAAPPPSEPPVAPPS